MAKISLALALLVTLESRASLWWTTVIPSHAKMTVSASPASAVSAASAQKDFLDHPVRKKSTHVCPLPVRTTARATLTDYLTHAAVVLGLQGRPVHASSTFAP